MSLRDAGKTRRPGSPATRPFAPTNGSAASARRSARLAGAGRCIGEGFDDARLDTLFLALPVSWKGTLVQYTGRLHRLRPGKIAVRIYDYVDTAVPMLARMFEKRLRGYRAIGYAREEAPLGIGPEERETPTELDGQALLEIALPDSETTVEWERDL